MTEEEKKDEKEDDKRQVPNVSGGWSPFDGISGIPDPIEGPEFPCPEYPPYPGGPVKPFPGTPIIEP